MPLKPKLPISDETFAIFKRGVDASRKETRKHTKLWSSNVAKTFGDIPKDYDDGDVVVNKDYSRVKQKTSQLFFRVPEVQLKPLRPDAEPIAAVAAAALNQVLTKEMAVSYMMDEVLNDVICSAGIGVSKISYEAITQPVEVPLPEYQGIAPEILAGLQETGVETTTKVDVPTYECYDWRRVPTVNFLYPPDFDGSNYDEAPWLGVRFTMPGVEAKRLYKLSDKEIKGTLAPRGADERLAGEDKDVTVEQVQGHEIWYRACYFDAKVAHKDHFRKLVYFSGMDKPVVHEDSPYQSYDEGRQLRGLKRYPIRVLSLTYVPDRVIPPSDVTITRPQVLEQEKIRTLMMLQRERSIPQRGFDTNAVDEETESLLERGVFAGLIPFNGPHHDAIWDINKTQFPRENFDFNRIIEQDMSESWAIGAEQMGQSAPGETTAREVGERAAASQTRLDYERAKVLRFFREGAEVVFCLLQKFATQPKYAELVGDDGSKRLVEWNAQTIQGEFAFEARPDAALRLDAASDRQEALNLYQLLRRDELVDARGLLTEVVRAHNQLPEKVMVQQPPQPAPEKPNISFRFDADALDPTRPHSLLVYDILAKSGMELDPNLVAQARALATKMLEMAAANPLLGLADTTRVDIRGNAAPMAGATAAPQPEHGGVQPQVEPLNKTQQDEGRVK